MNIMEEQELTPTGGASGMGQIRLFMKGRGRSAFHPEAAVNDAAHYFALVPILLQKDFSVLRGAILIQGHSVPSKIESSSAPLGFDSCVVGACHRLLQQNLPTVETG